MGGLSGSWIVHRTPCAEELHRTGRRLLESIAGRGGNHQHQPVSTVDLCMVLAGLDDGVRRKGISLASWRGAVADPADTFTAALCPIAPFFPKAYVVAQNMSLACFRIFRSSAISGERCSFRALRIDVGCSPLAGLASCLSHGVCTNGIFNAPAQSQGCCDSLLLPGIRRCIDRKCSHLLRSSLQGSVVPRGWVV